MSDQNKLNQEIYNALSKKNYRLAEELLQKGADINGRSDNKYFLLKEFIRSGHVDTVKWLVDHGANVNIKDSLMQTPLHSVCDWHNKNLKNCDKARVEMAYILLENGADVNAYADDCGKHQPLHLAVNLDNCIELVRLLLDYGADVNAFDGEGKLRPLHIAACFARDDVKYDLVKLLLEYGANPLLYNNDMGWPILKPREFIKDTAKNKAVIDLLDQWETLTKENKRPSQKKPTFSGKYKFMSSDEIFKLLTSKDGLNKVRKNFKNDFEPLVVCMDYNTAMRVYVHIYKKLTPIEKATYQKGVIALQKQQKEKEKQRNIIKKPEETKSR